MKFTRKANANWKGTGLEGKGTISTQSTTLDNAQLSFKTRFADGVGTNPEELIAAAHSGCYTMQLGFLLNEAGFTADNLDTEALLTFEDGTITKIHLQLSAQIPGIDNDKFQEIAATAKAVCPVSKVLNAEITLDAVLN
ncbi:OsmC family protein [Flavobacterium silvaticum]|uniref:OsmC family protein n=1 Tax=Flavobacterium silvaticum TaxID=1852020 RepID=A0A972FVW6_9FLAO|nr:OsmC family protein [Flavobacterium silvaticum]NMH28595.1 OsmC family protein [Flavobacterium silvaticum]